MPSLIGSTHFPELVQVKDSCKELFVAEKSLQLKKLIENNEFCNCTIQVGEEQFNVHLDILCASSDYFNTIVGHDYNASDVVKLHNITPDTFSILLNFLYTGNMDLDFSNLLEVYIAADYLVLSSVLEFCREFLAKKFHEGHISEALNAFIDIVTMYDDMTIFEILVSHLYLFRDKGNT